MANKTLDINGILNLVRENKIDNQMAQVLIAELSDENQLPVNDVSSQKTIQLKSLDDILDIKYIDEMLIDFENFDDESSFKKDVHGLSRVQRIIKNMKETNWKWHNKEVDESLFKEKIVELIRRAVKNAMEQFANGAPLNNVYACVGAGGFYVECVVETDEDANHSFSITIDFVASEWFTTLEFRDLHNCEEFVKYGLDKKSYVQQ
jgi:hypothetical protein